MWLFPFKNYYFKTELSRQQITQAVLDLTFLSDQGYRTDGKRKYFYGELDPESFVLQSIRQEDKLVPYTEARMRGVEDDMYLFLTFKAFKFRRIYIILVAFLMLSIGLLVSDFMEYGKAVFYNPPFYLFLSIILGMSAYLIWRCYQFWRLTSNSINFYRGLFNADLVPYKSIPVVFKL